MRRSFNTPLLGLIAGTLGALSLSNEASAYTEQTLYKFCSEHKCTDGVAPFSIVMDRQGNIYGTTPAGGYNYKGRGDAGYGVVYEFSPATQSFQVLHTFCQTDCTDGANPYHVKLVIDTRGNLYGTTKQGGIPEAQGGTVFELVNGKSGWQYKVIYTFGSQKHDAIGLSEVGLTYSGQAAGALYDGTSPLYGVSKFAIYQLTPKKSGEWKQKLLHFFCHEQGCTDGAQPEQPLYLDGSGNFFGTTEIGGANSRGTVFELSPAGDGSYTFSVLHSFCAQQDCTDGEEPFSSSPLIMDGTGDLMGTAAGGEKGDGLIYGLTPQSGGGWQYDVLTSFDKKNAGPTSLIFGNDGSLFGASYAGGQHDKGTVFQYSDSSFQTLYNVCQARKCPEGAQPFDVIQDSAGNLFGTNEIGGIKNRGTLFELVNDKPVHHGK